MTEQNFSVFIVDDDIFLLDMYALKFKENGFAVETALGSSAALEKLRGGFMPDVMLLDIVMPEFDGFELLEKMNTESLAGKTKKIILSNRGQESDIERGKSLGVNDYIVKARATPSEIILKVRSLLGSN